MTTSSSFAQDAADRLAVIEALYRFTFAVVRRIQTFGVPMLSNMIDKYMEPA